MATFIDDPELRRLVARINASAFIDTKLEENVYAKSRRLKHEHDQRVNAVLANIDRMTLEEAERLAQKLEDKSRARDDGPGTSQ